ncbi:hypothetical protein [uncultured Sphingomonas sp.]|uniref:hypothetical protein n=1 Tax=uncultured Sphingomonas sp. TaxID=158754 RepID=UPI0035CCA68B
MLDMMEVRRIVNSAALSALKKIDVSTVLSEPSVDSDGNNALSVTIVMKNGSLKRMNGDLAPDTIVRIRHDLDEAGEERTPIVYSSTERELEQDGGR